MDILLTNDDGIQALGLRSLHAALERAGHTVHVVAPIQEQSAVGHAITFLSPLRVQEIREDGFFGLGVHGTPADCVKLGVTVLVDKKPDLVMSGINKGANVGVDILYSGTVSAATEGALMGLPAMAVSVDDFLPTDLTRQGDFAASLIDDVPWAGLPDKTVVNLNFPAGDFDDNKGLKVCAHTTVAYNDWYEERKDPRGRPYYWLDGNIPPEKIRPNRDRALLSKGHITLTPLRFDFTDLEAMDVLSSLI